jgi:D-aminopeptidase
VVSTNSTDERKPAGSCIGIVVTDAPVDGASCARLARRVGLGLARAGSTAHHGSGEIFMAFGTGMRMDRDGNASESAHKEDVLGLLSTGSTVE